MEKVFDKEQKKRDDVASTTASIHGVSPSYVRMVANGKRVNDKILGTYNKLKQAKEDLVNGLTNQEA